MNKPPMAHRVQKPFKYVPSNQTDVARTIKEARKALEAEKAEVKPTNVRALKKERQAA